MSLYLVESTLKKAISHKEGFENETSALKTSFASNGINLIEVQVSKDFSRVFYIFEADVADQLESLLKEKNIQVDLLKEVRIVGKDLDEVKKEANNVNYLVEWNLPEDLTMDQYLARKKKNSVHYAEVPEVSFARTYVCEDMSKCLCFYDAPDEDAVKRAREAVKTPLDSITEINK
ncbi:DUF4242 domain-containing protein [Jeotgalibacillus salarius]|uniref:DUF4242 domain-containing protein n=1 Tax=Jeotgalibacillus salarius TaxID=546023 RepID=A0A4Y8LEN9_9BACL|nr:DUF4242 domain-containing protein [Jeotgalibacillus salarius]TFE00523.1 DUF4242 domain-containing protein [Jeotgalibacillus salarius]